jgi:penicillin-insensitive murein endopeptidase
MTLVAAAALCAALAARGSVSIGTPLGGRLENGVAVPLAAPGLRHDPRKDPERRYGTAELVGALVRAAEAVRLALPGGELTIADLSARSGGDIPGHASHRSGRDVDVSFYLLDGKKKPRPGLAIPIEPDGHGTDYHDLEDPADDERVLLDVPRTWKFVEALLLDEGAHLQRIFVVEHVRAMLLEHARKAGAPSAAVELFAAITCQPAFPHDDHMHLRVYCAPDDVTAGCEDVLPIHPRHRERLRAAGVEPKLARPRKGPRPALTSHAEARAAAGAMHADVAAFLERREAWLGQPHPGRRYCP